MREIKENNKEKALIEEKKGIWAKIKNWFRKLKPEKTNQEIEVIEEKTIVELETQQIEEKVQVVEEEYEETSNIIINQARKAYENYMLNDEFEIGERVYNYIKERIVANKESIERIIEINKAGTSFNKIIEIFNIEKAELSNYKKTIKSNKIDEIFMFAQYQVPVGTIGIETENAEEAISNIFKAVTTRNAIIVIQEKYNQYSIENLILLIVKESLNKFNIDDNIIQIVEEKEVEKAKEQFDILINSDGKETRREYSNKLYIYQEDEYFKEIIKEEIEKLKAEGKEVEVITGDFYKTINKLNKKINYGVSIYSKDRKKGYKFINLVNSKNVFFNSTLQNAQEIKEINKKYLVDKNIVCEYKVI